MSKRRRSPSARRTVPQRSSRDWLARGALALGAFAFGIFSVGGSFARVVEGVDPARAVTLAPGNGVILAASAQQAFTMAPSQAEDSNPARLARLALREDPTAVDALNVLGLQAQLRGETERAREIFQYSLLLTRRELRPQIWAIEEAVNRGDVAAALRSYDIALRTSKEAPGLLLPNLVAALAEPKVRSALLSIMASEPRWMNVFLHQVATSGIDPEAAVLFFREGEAIKLPVNNDLRAALVNGLLARGEVEQAWEFYADFRRGAVRNRSRDANFALNTEIRAPFDWLPSTEPGISATILQQGDAGLLDFALPPGTGGTLVQQTQLLSPGTYRIAGRSRGISLPERSRPYWVLLCQDGRELGRVEVPDSNVANGVFEGTVRVPGDCRVQTLLMVARASDGILGVSGQIERASLVPAGAIQ